MMTFIKELRTISNSAIESFSRERINKISKSDEGIISFRDEKLNFINRYSEFLYEVLSGINPLDDNKLIGMFEDSVNIVSNENIDWVNPDKNFFFKINHGFWEFLAFLHSDSSYFSTYRPMTVEAVKHWYDINDNMAIALSCFLLSDQYKNIHRMGSPTTGKISYDNLIRDFISKLDCGYSHSQHQRGAFKGLLSAAMLNKHLTSSNDKLCFSDSYALNNDFDTGRFANQIIKNAKDTSVCLTIGPARVSVARIINWPGSHAHFTISHYTADKSWIFNLVAIQNVIAYLQNEFDDVYVLFQGATLSCALVSFLADSQVIDLGRLYFYDVGRLLDMALKTDLTKTGSPLPSNRLEVDFLISDRQSEYIFEIFK
jgi:hypothetical protein